MLASLVRLLFKHLSVHPSILILEVAAEVPFKMMVLVISFRIEINFNKILLHFYGTLLARWLYYSRWVK